MPITSKLYQKHNSANLAWPTSSEDNTKNHRLCRVHQNLKPQSDDGGPLLWRKTQLPVKPPPDPPAQETGARWAMWVPAAWGGLAARGAQRGSGLGGWGRVRVVGGEHHAARVLHFHRQPRMASLGPENKGGDQHGPAHRPVPGGVGRRGRRAPGAGPPPAAGPSGRGLAAPPAARLISMGFESTPTSPAGWDREGAEAGAGAGWGVGSPLLGN